jgi:hypothetical protein
VLAPPVPAMRAAVRRAASFCRLEAALLLAPPAASMRLAVLRVASSPLGAALVLAPPAPAMRAAVRRAARVTIRNLLIAVRHGVAAHVLRERRVHVQRRGLGRRVSLHQAVHARGAAVRTPAKAGRQHVGLRGGQQRRGRRVHCHGPFRRGPGELGGRGHHGCCCRRSLRRLRRLVCHPAPIGPHAHDACGTRSGQARQRRPGGKGPPLGQKRLLAPVPKSQRHPLSLPGRCVLDAMRALSKLGQIPCCTPTSTAPAVGKENQVRPRPMSSPRGQTTRRPLVRWGWCLGVGGRSAHSATTRSAARPAFPQMEMVGRGAPTHHARRPSTRRIVMSAACRVHELSCMTSPLQTFASKASGGGQCAA